MRHTSVKESLTIAKMFPSPAPAFLLSARIQGLPLKSSIKYHFLLAFLLPTFSRLPPELPDVWDLLRNVQKIVSSEHKVLQIILSGKNCKKSLLLPDQYQSVKFYFLRHKNRNLNRPCIRWRSLIHHEHHTCVINIHAVYNFKYQIF